MIGWRACGEDDTSDKCSGEAIGEGIEDAGGNPRQRLLLVRFKQCSACGAKKGLKPPQW